MVQMLLFYLSIETGSTVNFIQALFLRNAFVIYDPTPHKETNK